LLNLKRGHAPSLKLSKNSNFPILIWKATILKKFKICLNVQSSENILKNLTNQKSFKIYHKANELQNEGIDRKLILIFVTVVVTVKNATI
jgi:hypothetical protein